MQLLRTRTANWGVPLCALLLLALAIGGCAHVVLISPYDEPTDKGITALEGRIDLLIGKLDQEPVPAYDPLKASYVTIRADLAALRFRNEARPKNTLTVKQLDELKAELDIFEKKHADGTLRQVMVGPAGEAFSRTLRALLTLELEKKELK